jgi:uncharacterized protein YdbL (DUF1318 family)
MARLGSCCAACLAAAWCGGCKQLPDIPITTPEPLQMDIRVRLDVYQHGVVEEAGDDVEMRVAGEEAYEGAALRVRERMEEIQTLKNNRLVGENHNGLLSLRERPGGEWGDYVQKTVEAENADRRLLMRQEAARRDVPMHEVGKEQWQSRIASAFDGEWIEVAGEEEGTFRWARAGE